MLTDKEKKVMAMYEKQLRMPKVTYIILYGVLLWGLSVLLMMTLVDRFLFNKSFERQWQENLPVRMIIMPFAGIFFGWFMRRLSEKKLAKLREKERMG